MAITHKGQVIPASLLSMYQKYASSTFAAKNIGKPAKLKPYRPRVRRRTPKKEQPYPLIITEKGWQDKKWIRLDDLTSRGDRRVWRNAKFLSDELFLTRYNHKHGSCLYHICNHFGKWVFYCRVPKGFTECSECEKPIDQAVLMIQNLQKLKR